MMGAVLVIAGKDLRQRLRDRSAIVLGFVAPLVISGLMSMALGRVESFQARIGVVDADHGPVAAALVDALHRPELRGIVKPRSVATDAEARRAVRSGRDAAAIVIPGGFSGALAGGAPVPLTVLTSVDNRLAGQVAQALADSFVAQLNADRLAVAAALATGAPGARAQALTALAAGLRLPEGIAERPIGARPLKAISYGAPGMALLFLFFAIGFGSRSFFAEQREGTLDRMAAAPVRPVAVLAGKALAIFVYGAASLAVMVVATTALYGARWGDPPAAAALCLAVVVSVVCLTALVITVARTERQAEGLSSMIVFGLALLGGNFVLVSVAPPLVRRLALFTPNGWALRGFLDLATGSGRLGSVVTPIAAILGFSAVVGAIAAMRAGRVVTH